MAAASRAWQSIGEIVDLLFGVCYTAVTGLPMPLLPCSQHWFPGEGDSRRTADIRPDAIQVSDRLFFFQMDAGGRLATVKAGGQLYVKN